MLKRLAILAVLAGALSPMPGKTIEATAQGADNGKSQSQGNQPPRPASPQIKKPEEPSPSEKHSGAIASEDKEHSVKLTSLPPVTLTDKPKGFWDHVLDWGPWVSNFLLVVVGGFQVGLLWKTWQKIGEQATHMKTQTGILKDSVTAAQTSADAALAQVQIVKDKERAQIRISFRGIGLSSSVRGANYSFPVVIHVDGMSRATILQAAMAAWIPLKDEERRCFGEIDMSKTVFPSEQPISFTIFVTKDDLIQERENDSEKIRLVKENKLFIVVEGYIRYEDVFHDVWVLPFSQVWENDTLYGGPVGGHSGCWRPYRDQHGEANREYREKPGSLSMERDVE